MLIHIRIAPPLVYGAVTEQGLSKHAAYRENMSYRAIKLPLFTLMLSQIILQCGLFDVDISRELRELSRFIFNSKNTHFLSKKGEKDVFFKMFPFHQFPKNHRF